MAGAGPATEVEARPWAEQLAVDDAFARGASAANAANVDDLAFLAGSWHCKVWGGEGDEFWSKPAAGTISARARRDARPVRR